MIIMDEIVGLDFSVWFVRFIIIILSVSAPKIKDELLDEAFYSLDNIWDFSIVISTNLINYFACNAIMIWFNT